MKAFAISDPHGCAKTLETLVDVLALDSGDHLFLLGDYVNKGPNAKGVLDLVMHWQEAPFNMTALKGNHDQLLLDASRNRDMIQDLRGAQGGSTLLSFGIDDPADLPDAYLQWIEQLPTVTSWQYYLFVHAGFRFDISDPLADQRSHLHMRGWYDQIDYQWLGERIIIHGHDQTTGPAISRQVRSLVQNQVLNIDAGCVNTEDPGKGYLCAFDLIHRSCIFQPNVD